MGLVIDFDRDKQVCTTEEGYIKFKKAVRHNFRTSYNEYRKETENPEAWEIYGAVISDFLYEINRAIIIDKYEWKIPFFGGYLRISKKPVHDENKNFKRWWYYWKWDKTRNSMHWPKVNTWSFKAVEGRCKRRRADQEDIGETGLWKHIESLLGNYDVLLKNRAARPVNFKEFVDSL